MSDAIKPWYATLVQTNYKLINWDWSVRIQAYTIKEEVENILKGIFLQNFPYPAAPFSELIYLFHTFCSAWLRPKLNTDRWNLKHKVLTTSITVTYVQATFFQVTFVHISCKANFCLLPCGIALSLSLRSCGNVE